MVLLVVIAVPVVVVNLLLVLLGVLVIEPNLRAIALFLVLALVHDVL